MKKRLKKSIIKLKRKARKKMPTKAQQLMEQMVRRVCNEENLTSQQTEEVVATIWCESQMNPSATNKNKDGSTDYGLCQFNDYWWIGEGKAFPDPKYVLNNPVDCVREMCHLWKNGKMNLWVCYNNGGYKKYLKVDPNSNQPQNA